MLPRLGMPELAIILVIAILIFGPRALPKLGRSLGEGIRAMRSTHKEFDKGLNDREE